VSWSSDPRIRVISEGSCESEDWSNDAEHSGINYTLLYIKLSKYLTIILFFCCCCCIFKCSLDKRRAHNFRTAVYIFTTFKVIEQPWTKCSKVNYPRNSWKCVIQFSGLRPSAVPEEYFNSCFDREDHRSLNPYRRV